MKIGEYPRGFSKPGNATYQD